MKFTPAAIARIALAIAAIPLIGALIAALVTFCVAAFVISFVVSWLHVSDKKLHWSLLTAAWASTVVIVQQVLTWLAARGYGDVEEVVAAEESLLFALPPELRRDLKSAGAS